jgi:hypothetical protein
MFLIFYLLPYVVFFMLVLMMPGRRSLLLLLAGVLGLPLAWLLWESFRSMGSAPGGAILGSIVVAAFIGSAVAGLIAGVMIRAISLRFLSAKHSRVQHAVLVLIAGLAIPSILAASVWWSQWKIRVPDDACLNAKHHVSIAGLDLWLPSAPIFTPWMGEKELYSFSSHERMRSFCSISLKKKTPIEVVNLSIHPEQLSFKGQPQRDKFCAATTQEWAKLLCRSGALTATSNNVFPEEISIYSSTRFDHKKMLVSEHSSYAGFLKKSEAAILSGHPLQALPDDDFDQFSNGYWIARDETWRNDAGEPFSLYCYETKPSGTLYCTTTYRLSLGPQVTYSFRAPQERLASVSRTVDANLHFFLRSLSAQ